MYQDGRFYTGDVGRVRADGLLTITGRSSDVINRGGVVVAPEYIEEVIGGEASIADVAAFGLNGPLGLEEIWAAVVSDRNVDAAALIAAIRAKLNESTPDRVIQVKAIPRGDSGRVLRAVLREWAGARLADQLTD